MTSWKAGPFSPRPARTLQPPSSNEGMLPRGSGSISAPGSGVEEFHTAVQPKKQGGSNKITGSMEVEVPFGWGSVEAEGSPMTPPLPLAIEAGRGVYAEPELFVNHRAPGLVAEMRRTISLLQRHGKLTCPMLFQGGILSEATETQILCGDSPTTAPEL